MSIMQSSAVKGRELRSGIKDGVDHSHNKLPYRLRFRAVPEVLRDFYRPSSDSLGASILTATRLEQRHTVTPFDKMVRRLACPGLTSELTPGLTSGLTVKTERYCPTSRNPKGRVLSPYQSCKTSYQRSPPQMSLQGLNSAILVSSCAFAPGPQTTLTLEKRKQLHG